MNRSIGRISDLENLIWKRKDCFDAEGKKRGHIFYMKIVYDSIEYHLLESIFKDVIHERIEATVRLYTIERV